MVEYIAPATAVNYGVPAPSVFAAPVSVVEHISPAPAVFAVPVLVVEHISRSHGVCRKSSCGRVQRSSARGKLLRSAYSVCCTSSCRGKHFRSSCGVCRTRPCGRVHCSSASGKLCRISAYCVGRTSSRHGMHFSSVCDKLRHAIYCRGKLFCNSCSACRTCFCVVEYIASSTAGHAGPAPAVEPASMEFVEVALHEIDEEQCRDDYEELCCVARMSRKRIWRCVWQI